MDNYLMNHAASTGVISLQKQAHILVLSKDFAQATLLGNNPYLSSTREDITAECPLAPTL